MGISNTVKLNKLPVALAMLLEGAQAAQIAGAKACVADMVHELTEEQKSGVKYSDLPNRSSGPEEAPQNQLGGLLESFHVEEGTDVAGQIGAKACAGDGSMVASYLEGGTSNMAARPFMGPASVVGEVAVEAANAELAVKLSSL